ncbi:MAG: hypothetical protein GY694_09125 [Gammaproteobacteria bacterium]|nr:hypothetical protein [Gammaproteobacteria bacterium]
METWQTILLAIGGNTVVLAVLGFLGKSLLEKLLARDTARFEADLKSKADVTIAQLKSELELKAIEHQIRYSKLHEKRANVVAELYSLLAEGLWEAESFLNPIEWNGETKKIDKYSIALEKLAEVYRYFDKHRIYLPDELCETLHDYVFNIRSYCFRFGVYLNEDRNDEYWKALTKGYDSIKKETPKTKKALEYEFRKILGS